MPEPRQLKTLVMLQGGHTTLIHGIAPLALHAEIEEARESGHGFYFLQDEGAGEHTMNRVCVDPTAVVGLIRVN